MQIKGLYAVTPDIENTVTLCGMVAAAIQGGASIVQYRNKAADTALQLVQAQALRPICRQYGIPFIVNDDVALCLAVDADGVHLGADDGNISAARMILGPHKILGASCYNRFDLAQQAKVQGASYVAFGACFPSSTKPHAPVAGMALFGQATQLNMPSVAIGGITLGNAGIAIDAGADAIAVINALFGATDVQASAAQFSQLFE